MPLPKKKTQGNKDYTRKTYLFYGSPKVGKTTSAVAFGDNGDNKLCFFTTEAGHDYQDLYTWKTDQGLLPSKFEHFLQFCREILTEDHDYTGICIDTVDKLWEWCNKYSNEKLGIPHQSAGKIGQGWDNPKILLQDPLLAIYKRHFGIVFLAHSKNIEVTIGPRKFNKFDCSLKNGPKQIVEDMSDFILYFHKDHKGKRLIRAGGSENFNCGDRSGLLPDLMPMDMEFLAKHLKGEINNDNSEQIPEFNKNAKKGDK